MHRSLPERERLLGVTRAALVIVALLLVAVVAGYLLWEFVAAAVGPSDTVGPAG